MGKLYGLRYRIFDTNGEHIASARYPVDAAALAGMAEGRTIRYNSNRVKDTIWEEGNEDTRAGESWDEAGDIMAERATQLLVRNRHKEQAKRDKALAEGKLFR